MMTTMGVTLTADPRSVLDYLDPVLGQTGCIKSTQEVQKFVSLMKEAQVLVSRCIILNVIKATKTQSTLERFMEAGGWTILNLWLAEAKKNQNSPLIVEVLQVLQKLPVTIAALKQGNMGKLIKQLSKQEHPEVKHFAANLLAKWMAVFKDGQTAKTRGDRPSNSSIEDAGAKLSTTKPDKPDKPEKKERSGRRESKKEKSKAVVSPVEASQPPPGPLVALGRPKEKTLKRPRDLLLQKGQLPPEKKVKPSPYTGADDKSGKGKGPVESEGFMNALSSQAARMKEKKIKKPNKTPGKPTSSATNSKLASTSEGGEGAPSEGVGEDQVNQEETIAENEGPDVAYRKKKRVSWAEDDNLVMVHYFEMDESERANVSGHKSFLDAAQQEKMKEREALASGLMFSRDRLIEMMPWQRPVKLEGVLVLVERGMDSEQRKVQAEREEKVLAQLFLSKSSLPPTALEPDPEPDIAETETKFIPLMEPNAPDMHPHPVFPSPTRVVPPGQLLPDSPLPSPATTIHQAQSLINYYNETNHAGMPPRGPPMMDMQYQGGREGGGNVPPGVPPGDFFNYQQGFPPDNSWGGPPGPGYFGDQFFHGRGGGPPRGRVGGFRGRGGGRFFGKRAPYPDSRICKHFITHGCKLGSQCRFLHCTPEELASQMAHEQQTGQGPPPRPNGGPPPHHLEQLQQANHPVMEHADNPLAAPALSEQQT